MSQLVGDDFQGDVRRIEFKQRIEGIETRRDPAGIHIQRQLRGQALRRVLHALKIGEAPAHGPMRADGVGVSIEILAGDRDDGPRAPFVSNHRRLAQLRHIQRRVVLRVELHGTVVLRGRCELDRRKIFQNARAR